MIAYFKKYRLQFKKLAKTSRSELRYRDIWYLFLEENKKIGIGECAPLPGLSNETPEQVNKLLTDICKKPKAYIHASEKLKEIPSVRFAVETAWIDLKNGGKQILFPSSFTMGYNGIPINGLVWMGTKEYMKEQIIEKINNKFHCIKLKIGGIDFNKELSLLKWIRDRYNNKQIVIRVDANGSFSENEAIEKIRQLSKFDIHSIEQPIAPKKWNILKQICKNSEIPVALDEELIGINNSNDKKLLLDTVKPQFIVLKPSLHGGIYGCDEWINLADERDIKWWITSYLESNIGLNAIAQWAYSKMAKMHQGLGTGKLFYNNIETPLEIRGEKLYFNPKKKFSIPEI